MKEIILATNNQGKIQEFVEILGTLENVNLKTLKESNINIDVEEDGKTFEENAIKKAREIFSAAGGKTPVISEDSGILVDVLPNELGVYSKRFGEGKSEFEATEKLLHMLKNITEEKRTCSYVAFLCYYDGQNTVIAKGYCGGKLAFQQRGTTGFAYDYIFIPTENNIENKTFGELSSEFKNKISHRKRAIVNLLELLKQKKLI